MAERVTLVDDLDGSPDAVTRTFSIGQYADEIDLTEEHWRELFDLLERYLAAGRRVSGPEPPRRRATKMDPELVETIRVWAREHGHRVADRGRLPQAVIDAYEVREIDLDTA